MKLLLAVALMAVAACGGGDDAPSPFDPGACDSGWGSAVHVQPSSCDHECMSVPANFGGSGADNTMCYGASRPDGSAYTCERTFTTGTGITGCCRAIDGIAPGSPGTVEFFECP